MIQIVMVFLYPNLDVKAHEYMQTLYFVASFYVFFNSTALNRAFLRITILKYYNYYSPFRKPRNLFQGGNCHTYYLGHTITEMH